MAQVIVTRNVVVKLTEHAYALASDVLLETITERVEEVDFAELVLQKLDELDLPSGIKGGMIIEVSRD